MPAFCSNCKKLSRRVTSYGVDPFVARIFREHGPELLEVFEDRGRIVLSLCEDCEQRRFSAEDFERLAFERLGEEQPQKYLSYRY